LVVNTFESDFHYHLQILLKQPDFIETQNQLQAYTLYNILVSHFVLLTSSSANQQYFFLTPNQHQPLPLANRLSQQTSTTASIRC